MSSKKMDEMKDRDAQIRKLRYEKLLTRKAIGEMFGLCHERIRQIAPRNIAHRISKIKNAQDVLILKECIQLGLNLEQTTNKTGIYHTRIKKLIPNYAFQARIKKFWTQVQKGGIYECWPWLGYKGPNGYGIFSFKKLTRNRSAHVIAWIIHNNQPIIDSMQIQHTCDNQLCCNPKHLYIGTPLDNMRDRDVRGRGRNSRLFTEQAVIEMRKRHSNGESIASIHRSLDPKIYYTTVFNAIRGHTYKNIMEFDNG